MESLSFLVSTLIFLLISRLATPYRCNATAKDRSDLTPTVQENAVVTMSVWFTVSEEWILPDVYWYSTMRRTRTNVTDKLSKNADTLWWLTNFTIWRVTDDSWGRYQVIVCDHVIQNFTVIIAPKDCNDGYPPNATSMYPLNYIGPVNQNFVLSCLFYGYQNELYFQNVWNHSGSIIIDNSRENCDVTTSGNCSYIYKLNINNVTTKDSGIYMCYSFDTNRIGKPQTTTAVFLEYPAVLDSRPSYISLWTYDVLYLKWHVSGNTRYLLPLVSINDNQLILEECNCQLYFENDTVQSTYSYVILHVNTISELMKYTQYSSENVLHVKLYLKFKHMVLDVEEYNTTNSNHSQLTVIKIKSPPPIWYKILPYALGSLVLVIIAVIGAMICYCKFRRKNVQTNLLNVEIPEPINNDTQQQNGQPNTDIIDEHQIVNNEVPQLRGGHEEPQLPDEGQNEEPQLPDDHNEVPQLPDDHNEVPQLPDDHNEVPQLPDDHNEVPQLPDDHNEVEYNESSPLITSPQEETQYGATASQTEADNDAFYSRQQMVAGQPPISNCYLSRYSPLTIRY